MGAQDDFEFAQEFLDHTGMADTTMLWEGSGNIWQLNGVRVNSAMQLYSYDLSRKSDLIFFNDDGRRVALDASIQEPWAPPGSPNLLTASQ